MSCGIHGAANNELWGPVHWEYFHAITWMYPETPCEEEITMMRKAIRSFADQIPCSECKEHFKEEIEGLDYSSKEKLFEGGVRIHNSVNKRLGKSYYSLKTAIQKFQKYSNPAVRKNRFKLLFLFVGIVITFLLLCVAVIVYFKI